MEYKLAALIHIRQRRGTLKGSMLLAGGGIAALHYEVRLGKALFNIAPPDTPHGRGTIEHVDIALGPDLGRIGPQGLLRVKNRSQFLILDLNLGQSIQSCVPGGGCHSGHRADPDNG